MVTFSTGRSGLGGTARPPRVGPAVGAAAAGAVVAAARVAATVGAGGGVLDVAGAQPTVTAASSTTRQTRTILRSIVISCSYASSLRNAVAPITERGDQRREPGRLDARGPRPGKEGFARPGRRSPSSLA